MATLLMVACATGGVAAQTIDAPETLLGSCSFASQYNQTWCKHEQARFLDTYRKSLDKDYYSQRSIASCLFSGCDGAVTIDKQRACAWRLFILSSGSRYVDSSDKSNYRLDCAGMDTDADRGAIHAMANALMMRVYGKPLATP
jgi:hypothetical protein